MKLKLIQAGGFTGKNKTAEEELDLQAPVLQQQVTAIFNQFLQEMPKSKVRDKEQLFLEFDGKVLPVKQLHPNPELEKLIDQLINQLRFEQEHLQST